MARIGIIAMSAKPFHAGHDGLIRLAASENDLVKLYVSTSDRKRKGEMTISGEVMAAIWNAFIEESLPDNVEIEYGGSPIRKAYEFLGAENEAGSDDTYTIYSDPADMERSWQTKSLEKYMPDLYNRRQLVLEPVQRTETIDVSGTKMRQWLSTGDKEEFTAHLPSSLQPHGEEIWQMLLGPTGEALVRQYAKLLTR